MARRAKGGGTARRRGGGRKKSAEAQQTVEQQATEFDPKARAKLMRGCAKSMNEIDDKRAKLNEEAGDIRKRLRGAAIEIESWDRVRKLVRMEDQAARDAYITGQQEAWNALRPGEQAEMFPTVEAAGDDDAEHDFDGRSDPRPRFLRQDEDAESAPAH